LRPYLRRAYGLADRLICPSEYNREVIEGYTDAPTTVVSNGVDREKLAGFEELEAEYRDRYGLGSPTVFMVGHVIKRKGLETFVETAHRIPDVDFVWFGPVDRSLKGRETKRLVDESPSNCTFTGFVDDIRGAYAAGDVFCFPTHEENEGIALLEAMAAGKPLVVRDIETFSWLDDGEECLKVGSEGDGRDGADAAAADDALGDNVAGFVSAVNELRDADRRTELGANAAARSEAFSLDAIADRYRSLYAELA
jgi:glycosyltransferase involved in cell wall biosynthesis